MAVLKDHWDKIYSTKELHTLGWYEKVPEKSLELIRSLDLNANDLIFDAGAGVSYLPDNLMKLGFRNLILTDISAVALRKLKDRLNVQSNEVDIKYIQDNLGDPKALNSVSNVMLWHDRAVLHFLTDDDQRQNYVRLLRNLVLKKGYVLIAEFSLDGATKCSGLEVERYSSESIQKLLGEDFQLIKEFSFIYQMPSGDKRPYVYTLWKRSN